MDTTEPSLADSDIELSDAVLTNRETSAEPSNIPNNSTILHDLKVTENDKKDDVDDDDDDDDDDDEDSALQRLSGNYRRFSETQKSREIANNNFVSDVNGNIQINLTNMSDRRTDSFSDNRNEEEHEEADDDYVEDFTDEENTGSVRRGSHNYRNNEFEDDDHIHDDNDNDNNGDDENISRSNAIRMLANAISHSSQSSNGNGFSEFENFLSGRLQSQLGGTTTSSIDSNNNTLPRNSANNNNNPRTEMARLIFDQLMPSSGSSRISGLVEGLKTQKDAYLVMESLNEISSNLLMMTSIQSERQVPTYSLAENLVRVINEYPDDLELQLVACRCIYNLAEVNFELMYEIVSAGVIECLNSKLLDLSYIDMAEQALQALELISRKTGKQCLNKGSVPIALTYLDFFTIHAQRKALKLVANSTVFISVSKFDDIVQIFPTIKNVATNYTDSQCVESAWVIIANTFKNFYKNPELLDSLVDLDFLKKLCDVFPGCLGNGSKSLGLVTFKTGIALLDSLSLITSRSSKFSNELLAKCNIGFMITHIFSSYENSDNSNNTVSIDALLKCPKELLITLLKLISSLLPVNSSLIRNNISDFSDIGNYSFVPNDKKTINKEQNELAQAEIESLNSFHKSIFPLLLNIYDATVEYKVRRLVFLSLLRMLYMMTTEQLELIVYNSKITLILASTITHGKSLFQNKANLINETELLRLYSLVYGSLLIIECLINRCSIVFLRVFTKEGLISQMNELVTYFQNELKLITKKSDNIDESTMINDAEMSESENEDHSYQFDENEGSGEIISGNNNEFDENEDDMDEDEEDDEEEYDVDFRSFERGYRFNSNKYSYIMDDGLMSLSMKTIFISLISLFKTIQKVCEELSNSNNFSKSENILFLEYMSTFLKSDSLSTTENEWLDLWKKFATSLNSNSNFISSFELISSGVVNELLSVFQKEKKYDSLMCKTFQLIFCSALSPCVNDQKSPLYFLVKKLEESLDRNESFNIVGSDVESTQNSRSRAVSMTKQMKIKLVPADKATDGSDNNKQFMLVVQAIATFESIQNFIKNSKTINLKKGLNLNSSSLDNDYHYDFYINDEKIPSDATIFGVIYKSVQSKENMNIWKENLLKQVHVIKYKYVPGKLVPEDHSIPEESVDDTISTIGDNNIINTLKLLKVLYNINSTVTNPSTSDIIFLNYKLSAKLNRQLDEPLLVASGILPEWAIIIPREFPFLFPLETRLFFLKSTSFGYSRLIDFWLTKSKEEDTNSSNSNMRSPMIGRAIRHKLRISRDKIFSSAVKVMETYATNPGLIEIEYFEEVGSGLGPTLEFYSNVSKEFSKLKLMMWRSDQYISLKSNTVGNNLYVHDTHGLFPRPMHKLNIHLNNTLLYFKVLGKFLARSFLDSRLVDFHFNPLFFDFAMKHALSKDFKYDMNKSINIIKNIDEGLGSSLQHLKLYLDEYAKLPKEKWEDVEIGDSRVIDLMLTFVLPGYEEIKLVADGDDVDVTSSNLEDYINKIIDFTLYDGITKQIESFVSGFSEIFPFTSMIIFSSEELTRLSGNEIENWNVETLITMVHADHGYSNKSCQIEWLIEIMSNFDKEERRTFLKFITGSPRLPFDGFKGLSPPFTVVLKHCEDDLKPDDYLPSVMTCANYLKLPRYSSREIMYTKIVQAMNEGNNSFLLS